MNMCLHVYECVNNICNAVLNKSAQPSKIGAVTNINMTKCQYQQCKRVLNTRVERIKQNGNQIKSTHISYMSPGKHWDG